MRDVSLAPLILSIDVSWITLVRQILNRLLVRRLFRFRSIMLSLLNLIDWFFTKYPSIIKKIASCVSLNHEEWYTWSHGSPSHKWYWPSVNACWQNEWTEQLTHGTSIYSSEPLKKKSIKPLVHYFNYFARVSIILVESHIFNRLDKHMCIVLNTGELFFVFLYVWTRSKEFAPK